MRVGLPILRTLLHYVFDRLMVNALWHMSCIGRGSLLLNMREEVVSDSDPDGCVSCHRLKLFGVCRFLFLL